MPRPDEQPILPVLEDSTPLFTQIGAGQVYQIPASMLKSFLATFFASQLLQNAELQGNDLVLTFADTNTITIPIPSASPRFRIGTANPTSIEGTDDDVFLNSTTGDVFEKVAGSWILRFDFSSLVPPAGGGIVSKGIFADDAAASSGGVAIDEWYEVSVDSGTGFGGLLKRRKS